MFCQMERVNEAKMRARARSVACPVCDAGREKRCQDHAADCGCRDCNDGGEDFTEPAFAPYPNDDGPGFEHGVHAARARAAGLPA